MVITPDSWGSDLVEVWSDAARAASAAARRAKKQDADWRKAARQAYMRFARPTIKRAAALGRRYGAGGKAEGTRRYRRRAQRFAPEPTGSHIAAWVGGRLPGL